MKGILSEEKLPKFLRVNNFMPSMSVNKHLQKPYVLGEIVKVAPWNEQIPSKFVNEMSKYPESVDNDINHFHKRYVVVYRKDDEGKWSIKNTTSWNAFELLSKPIKK